MKVVILTGAGISAESGLRTFRDDGGLWEGHRITDVATPEAWRRDPARVLAFYNERREAVRLAKPNDAHRALASLDEFFDVTVITQNIDDLHERAGSEKVLHLHGEILKAQSTVNPSYILELQGKDISLGEKCPESSQLRPFVVWFGEEVPKMEEAIHETQQADIFIVVGTSLQVYPAAGLLDCAPYASEKYLIDLQLPALAPKIPHLVKRQKSASKGVPELVEQLIDAHAHRSFAANQ